MKLTNEEKSARIAEYFGWIRVNPDTVPDRVWPCKSCVTGKDGWWMMFPPVELPQTTGKVATSIPEYFTDLNVIQSAWGDLGWEEKNECVEILKGLVEEAFCESYFSTATQRAEAIGLTLKLWDAEP